MNPLALTESESTVSPLGVVAPDSTLITTIDRAAAITFSAYSRKSLNKDAPTTSEGSPVSVAVGFSGPRKGRVEVSIWRDALSELASSMFDQPGPPSQRDQLDAIREIANVIAGNVLGHLEPRRFFNLGVPKVQPDRLAEDNSPSAYADFALGSGRVSVRVFLEN